MRGYRQEIFFPYKDRFISFQPMKIGMVGSKSNSGGGVPTNHHHSAPNYQDILENELNYSLVSVVSRTFERTLECS